MHHSTANVAEKSETMTGQTLLLPTNRKSHMDFLLAYSDLTLTYSKGQEIKVMQLSTASICETVADRATIAIANE